MSLDHVQYLSSYALEDSASHQQLEIKTLAFAPENGNEELPQRKSDCPHPKELCSDFGIEKS